MLWEHLMNDFMCFFSHLAFKTSDLRLFFLPDTNVIAAVVQRALKKRSIAPFFTTRTFNNSDTRVSETVQGDKLLLLFYTTIITSCLWRCFFFFKSFHYQTRHSSMQIIQMYTAAHFLSNLVYFSAEMGFLVLYWRTTISI